MVSVQGLDSTGSGGFHGGWNLPVLGVGQWAAGIPLREVPWGLMLDTAASRETAVPVGVTRPSMSGS